MDTQICKHENDHTSLESMSFIVFVNVFILFNLLSYSQSSNDHRLDINQSFKSLTDSLNAYELIRFRRDEKTHAFNASSAYRIKNNKLVANFHAFGKNFPIIAYRTQQSHSKSDDRRNRRHIYHIYEGRLKGQKNSLVRLYLWKDHLHGNIKNDHQDYQLESIPHEYLDQEHERDNTPRSDDAQTVLVYRKQDLKESVKNKPGDRDEKIEINHDSDMGALL